MDALEAIRTRKSTRAFLSKPVPQEVLAQVLEVSRWAPSGTNLQNWRVTVVTGEKCRTLARRLAEWAQERQPSRPRFQGRTPEIRTRGEQLTADLTQVAETLGMSLWEFVVLGSYRLYDAPVVVVVSHTGKHRGNVPIFVTTMLIAAHSLGLGTCWLGYPLSCADAIHDTLDMPDEEQVSAVVAIGYPDPDSPANAYRSSRDEPEAFTRWVGFE